MALNLYGLLGFVERSDLHESLALNAAFIPYDTGVVAPELSTLFWALDSRFPALITGGGHGFADGRLDGVDALLLAPSTMPVRLGA